MTENIKLDWDGEKIKQTIQRQEKKFTPKEILDSLAHVRKEINQFEQAKTQIEQQTKANESNLRQAKSFEKDMKVFEEKCLAMQRQKLISILEEIVPECRTKAEETAKTTIAKDPAAYSDEQKAKLPYLDFQKNLATHPKVAKKISRQIIGKLLYETPIFTNPFV